MAKLCHVAIVPSPGMGHVIPIVEFTRRLVADHPNFRVTIIVPTIGQPTKTLKSTLESLPISVRHVYLPPVVFEDSPSPGAQVLVALSRSVTHIREVLSSLHKENNLSAIVVDMFGFQITELIKDFRLVSYVFFSGNAMFLSFFFYLPRLDQIVSGEYRDFSGPIEIPGCFPIHGSDLFEQVQDRKSQVYESILIFSEWLAKADGILINSFTEIEEGAFEALRECEGVPPVYLIGPLANDGSGDRVEGSKCLQWLDNQKLESVLFVSFGSGGTLSGAQLNELANGLENSGHKFLWVVRKPNDALANGAYFEDNNENDPLNFLPKGFLERTKEKGFVVINWAPQAQILSHVSTGGFLTHCGWNSSLESIVNGQPLITWPLFAEQKMNAVLLSEHLNVGLRPKVNDNGIVSQAEISKLVSNLMEGEEGKLIRKKMKLFQNGAKKALSEEGDSTKTLADLALKWSNHTST